MCGGVPVTLTVKLEILVGYADQRGALPDPARPQSALAFSVSALSLFF